MSQESTGIHWLLSDTNFILSSNFQNLINSIFHGRKKPGQNCLFSIHNLSYVPAQRYGQYNENGTIQYHLDRCIRHCLSPLSKMIIR